MANELEPVQEVVQVEIEQEISNHPVDLIMGFIESDNIAIDLEDDVLTDIANRVIEQYESDKESMSDWEKYIKWSRRLNEQTTEPRKVIDGAPFEGSSNFKSPILRESALKWSDRATTEILRHKELVKPEVITASSPAAIDKGQRIAQHINYQLNYQANWRKKHDKMLYEVPMTGNVFKKIFFNPISGVNETTLIHYPNFVVNNKTTNFDLNQDPFTEIVPISKNEVVENQRSGIWSDEDLGLDEDTKDTEFLEQQGYYDLDGDGYEEPYIFTVHKDSQKVVRVVARYDYQDVILRNEAGTVIDLEAVAAELDESMMLDPEIQILRIEPQNNYVKYGFIPSDDGTYLDWGYHHILGHLIEVINGTTNLMLDSGILANMPGGFLSKRIRLGKKALRYRPGEFQPTDIEAQDLQQGFMQLPFKGADQTLFNLNQVITEQARQMGSSIDLANIMSSNMPATTTLAMVQEANVNPSAIISRIHRSMSDEYAVIVRLNGKYTDPLEYQRVLNDPQADFAIDYSDENINVIPTASPELSSKTERIQMALAALDQLPLVKEEGGNTALLLQNYYEAIGYQGFEKIFEPTQGQASAQQQIEMQQQQLQLQAQQQQQQQLDMQERLLQLEEAKHQLNVRKQDWIEESDLNKEDVENAKTAAEIDKIESDTILNLEKAESEQVKNGIDVYTAIQNQTNQER